MNSMQKKNYSNIHFEFSDIFQNIERLPGKCNYIRMLDFKKLRIFQ